MLDQIISTFETGNGFWNPLIWITAVIIAFLIVYILRGFGKRDYKKGTDQTQVFLSGNPEYEKEKMHVKADNVYWGFTESLKWIYNLFKKIHTGNISDYVLWFVVIMAALFLLLGVI